MIKPTFFVLDLSPYPFDCLVGVNVTNELVKKKLKKLGVDADYIDITNCRGRTYRFCNGSLGLFLNDFSVSAQSYATISHEAFHVVEFLFDHIGIPYSKDTSEAWAYLLQNIVERILKKIAQ